MISLHVYKLYKYTYIHNFVYLITHTFFFLYIYIYNMFVVGDLWIHILKGICGAALVS